MVDGHGGRTSLERSEVDIAPGSYDTSPKYYIRPEGWEEFFDDSRRSVAPPNAIMQS
jgi:hypothetical protein